MLCVCISLLVGIFHDFHNPYKPNLTLKLLAYRRRKVFYNHKTQILNQA